MTALLDVNMLLSLAWVNHPHHNAAHAWFAKESHAGWATCLLTQIGFLRLSLNPQVVGVQIDCQAAVTLLAGLTAHPQHRFIDLAPTAAAAPFDSLVPRIVGHQQITDAALDQAAGALCPWPGTVDVLYP